MMKILNTFRHYGGTTKHKLWVAWFMMQVIFKLLFRALMHDMSKYSIKESSGFIQVIDKLKTSTYGSEEYKENLRKIKPSIDHHNKYNSHHPEYYKNEITGMSLIDLIEMLCDWQAAVKRHNDGNIKKSVIINQDRFQISYQLRDILLNSLSKPIWPQFWDLPLQKKKSDHPETKESIFFTKKQKLSPAVALIYNERYRQIYTEGWDKKHDAEHNAMDLALGAASYILDATFLSDNTEKPIWERLWNFPLDSFKPTPEDPVRQLVKAGAMLAAEIDRILNTENNLNNRKK